MKRGEMGSLTQLIQGLALVLLILPGYVCAQSPSRSSRNIRSGVLDAQSGVNPLSGRFSTSLGGKRGQARPAVLSLIIAADDERHLLNYLGKLRRVQEKGAMAVGQVLVIDPDNRFALVSSVTQNLNRYLRRILTARRKEPLGARVPLLNNKPPASPALALLQEMGRGEMSIVSAEKIVRRYAVTSSPTWIMRHRGQDYIFEGAFDPESINRALLSLDSAGRGAWPERVSLLDDEVPIALHQQRSTQVRLPQAEKLQGSFNAKLFSQEDSDPDEPAEFMLPVLPRCAEAVVRQRPVAYVPSLAGLEDVVFYDGAEAEQIRQADKWGGNSAAYLQGEVYDLDQAEADPWLMFAEAAAIECLPTRIRYVSQDGKAYREYREGERAWDNTEGAAASLNNSGTSSSSPAPEPTPDEQEYDPAHFKSL